jgi:hypothetical protein
MTTPTLAGSVRQAACQNRAGSAVSNSRLKPSGILIIAADCK